MSKYLFLLPLLVSCEIATKNRLEIEAENVSNELAQKLVAQYFSKVPAYDRGSKVSVQRCQDIKGKPDCDYLIVYWGNGCAWGSRITETKSEGKSKFMMSTYDEEVICE